MIDPSGLNPYSNKTKSGYCTNSHHGNHFNRQNSAVITIIRLKVIDNGSLYLSLCSLFDKK